MTDISGKKVLVTGASGGIGRLLAEKIAGRAGHLVLWARDAERLEALRLELSKRCPAVSVFSCDLADRAAVQRTAEHTLRACGPIDILVNNAGVVFGKYLLELSDEEIERTFGVNTLALFWTTRAFLPAMIARNAGHIVTIASAGGIVGTPRLTDYCASKFAALGFDEALRMELAHQKLNIKTTVVCPFLIDTGMFAGAKTGAPRLLPVLRPEYVAERIIGAVERDRSRLILPRFVFTAWPARLLPTRWFDGLMAYLGVTRSMDGFRGRGRG